MNRTHQFWTLLKFQPAINPFMWFMPIALGVPFFLTFVLPDFHPSLSMLLPVQNLFFVGLIGLMIMAPDMAGSWGAASAMSSGSEFLLTRAIDRPILYRARVVFFYVLILVLPLASLLHALEKPDLQANEYAKAARQECLRRVPGATLERDPDGGEATLISIPHGKVLVELWHFWLFAALGIAVQTLLLLLYPLRHRTAIFYTIFIGFVFVPLGFTLTDLRDQRMPYSERLFFSFAEHETAFWIVTALALIIGQMFCERRFVSLEQ